MFARTMSALLLCATWNTVPAQELQALKITALRGEGAFNDMKRHTAENVIVMVKNQDDRPVAGAKVTFTLPYSGAGGMFERNERVYTTTSGPDGRAMAAAFKPNSVEGRFNIRVAASHAGTETALIISQTNTMAGSRPEAGGHGKLLAILALLGGAGAAAGIALGRGGSQTVAAPVPPTSVSAGAISVGGPR